MKPTDGLQLSCLFLLLVTTFGLLVVGAIDSVQFYFVVVVFVVPACIGGLGVEKTGSRIISTSAETNLHFFKKLV